MTDINALFQGSGELGADALDVLTSGDLGDKIQAGLGIDIAGVEASELTLVPMLIDDSGSITSARIKDAQGRWTYADLSQEVRDGHNLVVEALSGTKQKDGILVHARYLNGHVLYPFTTLDQAVRMDVANYTANGGTPLYDETVALLGTVMAKAKEAESYGVAVRSVSVIVTDGKDQHSSRYGAKDVRTLVRDMLAAENHAVIGVGIGGDADFRHVFAEMGIPDKWILTPKADPKSLRAAFRMVSQSAVRASQDAGKLAGLSLGGFGS